MLLDTPLCDFGWKAPDFTLLDADGKRYTLSDYLGSGSLGTDQPDNRALLIAFICNHCPYVQAIADRFAEDARELQAEGINVLAVMSNDYHRFPSDAPKHMKTFAEHHNFSFPYLIDEDQSVARDYQAVCTPDFFGFNKQGELQYRGRIDDSTMGNPKKNRTRELVNAMRDIAETGRGPEKQTASMGCSIKWSE